MFKKFFSLLKGSQAKTGSEFIPFPNSLDNLRDVSNQSEFLMRVYEPHKVNSYFEIETDNIILSDESNTTLDIYIGSKKKNISDFYIVTPYKIRVNDLPNNKSDVVFVSYLTKDPMTGRAIVIKEGKPHLIATYLNNIYIVKDQDTKQNYRLNPLKGTVEKVDLQPTVLKDEVTGKKYILSIKDGRLTNE